MSMGGSSGDFIEPINRRTSALAVTAFVVSIIGCLAFCIPGPGAIAVILGGIATLLISRAAGRLSGMGLAITAIVLGLISSMTSIWMLVGVNQVSGMVGKALVTPSQGVMQAIEKGDMKGARAMFSRAADTAITDEMIADFAKAYQANVGNFQSMPTGTWGFMSEIMQMGPAMQNFQAGGRLGSQSGGNSATIPVPATFSKGKGVVALFMDEMATGTSSPNNIPQPVIYNLAVLDSSGNLVFLLPEDKAKALKSGGKAGGTGTQNLPQGSGGEVPAAPSKDAAPGAGTSPPKP